MRSSVMRSSVMRSSLRQRSAAWLGLAAVVASSARLCAQSGAEPPTNTGARTVAGPLVISTAGSLAGSIAEILEAFVRAHPGVVPRQSSSGSVEAARQAMDTASVPDILAVADVAIIPRLLVPRHASWYASFARNTMVLAYTDRSAHANEVTAGNWTSVLLRPGVRAGHSDPALDPGGYRARIVFQLVERHDRQPGLAALLDAAVPTVTPAPGDNLVAMLGRGALDYILVYRTTVRERGLRSIELPAEVNLSDPSLEHTYAVAHIRVATPGTKDSLEVRGEPILYGVTIPTHAKHAAAAEAFVRALLSADGRAVLRRHGFTVPERPAINGSPSRQ
jgi:molybdate/tungstate transport system substrate-binding protein